jgi:predicted Zn-ribbon and HTH transcriptional regulator
MAMLQGRGVPSKCRKCGRTADSRTFILDPVEKMMICPQCVGDRKAKSFSQQMKTGMLKPSAAAAPSKPRDWDSEDEYLNRVFKQKEEMPNFREVETGRLQCSKCKYVFKYMKDINKPKDCPYCGTLIRVK